MSMYPLSNLNTTKQYLARFISVASHTSPFARNTPKPMHFLSPVELASICVRRRLKVITSRWGWKGNRDLYTKLLAWGGWLSSWPWWSWWECAFFFLCDERCSFMVPNITAGGTSPKTAHCKEQNTTKFKPKKKKSAWEQSNLTRLWELEVHSMNPYSYLQL